MCLFLFSLFQGKAPDLKYLEMAARDIADVVVEGTKIVVEKSTVPVKAAESIATILRETKKPGVSFQVSFNSGRFIRISFIRRLG